MKKLKVLLLSSLFTLGICSVASADVIVLNSDGDVIAWIECDTGKENKVIFCD